MQRPVTIRVAVLAIAALAACDGGGTVAPDATTSPTPRATALSPTTSPSPAGTPTASPREPAPSPTQLALAPDRAIAVGTDGATLGELAIPSGRSLRQLEGDLGDDADELTFSPARGSVLVARARSDTGHEVVEVPLDGGDPDVVADGSAVAVTADGDRLAVARHEPGAPARVVLEVRTFAGEVLARWDDPVAPEEPAQIVHPSWSPDGTELAFELRLEDGTEVRTIDVAAADGSLQERSRVVEPPGDLRVLRAPTYRDGTLHVVDGPGIDPSAEQRWRIVAVDPASGTTGPVLAEADREIVRLDFDDSGEHLLYVRRGSGNDAGTDGAGGSVLVAWHDGTSVDVTEGIAGATW